MSSITPLYCTIQGLLQNQSFSIDEYQREYKWEKKHIDELISDFQTSFFNSYKKGDETEHVSGYTEYFLGSIIVSKRGSKKYLVDGQQRVTSLTLLLIYLYRCTAKANLDVTQTIAPLIYSDNLGKKKFNLDIPERLPVIEALFKGNEFTADGKDESIQTMYARYGDIEQSELAAELGEALPHFAYWLMTRVGLIEISTDNDNHAYAIFETMNDRGKPLSPVDMLKAYLLAPVEDVERRNEANRVWKKEILNLITWGGSYEQERDANFIKAWFRSQYAKTIRDRKAGAHDEDWELIGSMFHRWVRDKSVRLGLGAEAGNLRMISENLPFFAKAYQQILDASENYRPGLKAIFYNAHNDFTWQHTVLLASLVPTDDGEIVRRKLSVTAIYLDIWLMRRVVNYIRVGYSATYYSMWLLCSDIRQKPLDELVAILTEKLAKDEKDISFAGSASRNRSGLSQLSINQSSRRYIYHLLARLTAFTEIGAGRSDPFPALVDRLQTNPFDIEHILADNYADNADEFVSEDEFHEWRNHVASLLLLPADVNRSLQDKTFDQKAPHYAKQNFYAASLTEFAYEHQPKFKSFKVEKFPSFQSFEKFGKDEQLKRRELIDELANKIWSSKRLMEAAK